MVNHQLQREILSRARFWPDGARYSQLNLDYLENDLFNYHLQHLVKNGCLKKIGDVYLLTEKGKTLVTNIDEIDLESPPSYKVSVYLVPVVDRQVLLCRRLKHPQYGYVGFISEKLKYGESILVGARRGLEEETGLKAEFEIIGNLRQVRRNRENNVIEDGVFYICFTDKVEGALSKKSQEGEYFWVDLDKVRKVENLFRPSVELVVNEVKKSQKRTFICDLEPDQENY